MVNPQDPYGHGAPPPPPNPQQPGPGPRQYEGGPGPAMAPPEGQQPPPPGPYPPGAYPPGQYPYPGGPPPGREQQHPGGAPPGPPQPPHWPPGAHPQGPPPKRGSAAPWIVVGVVVALFVLIGGGAVGAYMFLGDSTEPGPTQPGGHVADSDLDGVVSFDDLSPEHTDSPVDYPQHPPVGGEHRQEWLNCGVYDEEVPAENAVHSLEHGAVWISHDPDLPAEDVESLRGRYSTGDYLVVSPIEDLPGPVVLSAWGKQLILESADDDRVDAFIREYQQGPQTPEPGAPCSGMVGEPIE
ncbi:uncharacterized protein DUF3105 [Murinocardiopsis flavida]|uniref:Uncharacterized protein DUF3105 n=1 Tax=Murinocardiopsis flavida TaxID=645275 RepID=A0A2P8DDY1_9ACTN|nr:DUF3105 domain-containing protein [Murinocardiopsis flavida]PSK95405.1 uncharacterized protein DUF3105 [Murinocardiopsis flavida]